VTPLLAPPVQPDPAQGRAWAREELAGAGYDHPGVLRRLVGWLGDRLGELGLGHGTGTALTGALVLVVLAVLVLWAVRRAGLPLGRRSAPRPGEVFDDAPLAATAHRAAADRASAAGDLRTAVLERFRAIVRELEEREVVPEQPGRTAGEAAAAAGARLPALAGELAAAARLFGGVRYGDHDATASADAALAALDAAVRDARPTVPSPVPVP
jgi:hypothetical protein